MGIHQSTRDASFGIGPPSVHIHQTDLPSEAQQRPFGGVSVRGFHPP
jgi:hypothetical protein